MAGLINYIAGQGCLNTERIQKAASLCQDTILGLSKEYIFRNVPNIFSFRNYLCGINFFIVYSNRTLSAVLG